MFSSDLYAQRYKQHKLDYDGDDDSSPLHLCINTLILIGILIALWVNKDVTISWKLYLPLAVVIVVSYVLMFLYEWFFYMLLAFALLGFLTYNRYGYKIKEFISKHKRKDK